MVPSAAPLLATEPLACAWLSPGHEPWPNTAQDPRLEGNAQPVREGNPNDHLLGGILLGPPCCHVSSLWLPDFT